MSNLADRVSRVRLLLETLDDPYPTPRGALRSDSGPAASRYVPCETCKRSGWLRRRRNVMTLCLACDGHGWRRRQHGEGEWDAYLVLPVAEAVLLPQEGPPRARADANDDEVGYVWERLREAYDARGSYREVRIQLERLGFTHPRREHLIRAVLVERQERDLERHDRRDLDLGVVQITLRMRSIRVPPWLLQHEQTETNDAIRALASQGLKPGQIATRLALSPDLVKRVLRRARQRGNEAALAV